MHPLEAYILEKWSNKFDHFSLTVGLSGGVDSVVLLHLLKQNSLAFNLESISAIHINHGISPNASQWEQFCINLCKTLSIPLTIKHHKVNKEGGESLENNARIIRYKEYNATQQNIIALGHHKKDQIETILSQVMRGSSLHNIAGMLPISQKQNKIYWRPLLDINKDDIYDYARHYNLSYIEDESNQDTTYLRNFIRLNLYPLMSQYDEHIDNKILNLGKQIQDITAQLDEITKSDFDLVYSNNILKLDILKKLPMKRQFNVLVLFLKHQALPIPTNSQLNEFIRQINTCAIDKHPSLLINAKYRLIKNKLRICIEVS